MDNGSSVIKKDISYEWAQPSDWTECMSLVWTTFMEFEGPDYTPEGVGHFFVPKISKIPIIMQNYP